MSERGAAPVVLFLAVVYGGSLLLSLLIGLTGGQSSAWIGLAPVSMFIPALGVLAARLKYGERLHLAWKRLPLLWLPAALFLMPLAIHALALPGVIALEGRLPWAAWLTPAADGLYHAPADRNWGAMTSQQLAGRIAMNAAIGLTAVSLFAFFEEIGWRAFLLPRLAARIGILRASATAAAVWALWHIPYALSGVQHIDHVSPLALALLSPAGNFGAGLFLAVLWWKTASIVLVSLAHGALNNWGQYAFKFMETGGENDTLLLAIVNLALLLMGISSMVFLVKSAAQPQRTSLAS